MDKCFPEEAVNIFRYPARIVVAGTSNSGKSYLIKSLITKYYQHFTHIFICGVTDHELKDDPKIKDKLYLSKDIIDPTKEIDEFEVKGTNTLLILDDLQRHAVESPIIFDTFTKGRHKNISICMIQQNLFLRGKFARDIALNASHFILLKMRDLSQIQTLARQIYGRGKMQQDIIELYKKVVLNRPFGYLLIDLALNTPTELQLRSNIAGEEPCEVVYLPWEA